MLDESTVQPDPVSQFRLWFDEARNANQPEADAMTLSTVSEAGRPSARVVLLKTVDERGFVFYTNRRSRKGRELEAYPHVALTFWWHVPDRQIRIEGTSEHVPEAESDAYFSTRPRESRLGAWASEQSEQVVDRKELERRFAVMEQEFEGKDVPRPPHWGGYLVRPERVEFMERRPGRLHDRIVYVRAGAEWKIVRLSP